MIGYPLDSHVTFESDGTPVYDRAITSAPLRKLYKKLFSDGVMPNPSNNMQVSAGSGMNVIVSPGFAMCNGCLKLEEAQRTLAVQASSATYDRIDTVVLRLNDNDSERICDFYILEGTPATSPVRPTLTRTESIWELGLADLFIAKNSTVISNQRITDTRYETERCGVVSSVSKFDTDFIYQQVQADLAGFKSEEQADFIAWFEEIKGQLSEDAAGNLQNQIGSLPSLATEIKTNIVAAINWVAEKMSALASRIGTSDISKIGDGTVTGAIASQNVTFTKSIEQLNTNLSTKANATDLITKASTADLNAEKATREKVDASLQSQINETKSVASFGFGTIISDVAEFVNGYLLKKNDIVYFSLAFNVHGIANGISTNIASIPYKPYAMCHCPAVLYNGSTSYSVFASINDGVIQIHLPSDVVLNQNAAQNQLRFSGSFPSTN